MPLSNTITRNEPRAASADCHGTLLLRRRGIILILAFLGDGYHGTGGPPLVWSPLVRIPLVQFFVYKIQSIKLVLVEFLELAM